VRGSPTLGGVLKIEEVRELDGSLRALLGGLDAGELDGTERVRARIEGAVIALDAVAGTGDVDSIVESLAHPR
jgi:hypothetical protein